MRHSFLLLCLTVSVIGLDSARAEFLQLEAEITVRRAAGSETARGLLHEAYLSTVKGDVTENPAALMTALNASEVIQSGFQYSFPAHFVVELRDNGRIVRYRVDYIRPLLQLADPQFSADNPIIDYRERVTIIQSATERYCASVDIESGTRIERLEQIADQEAPIETTLPEYWLRDFSDFQQFAEQKGSPNLSTTEFDIYTFGDLEIRLYKKSNVMESYRGPTEKPTSYARLECSVHRGHLFPTFSKVQEGGDEHITQLQIKRPLPKAEGDEALSIPRIGVE